MSGRSAKRRRRELGGHPAGREFVLDFMTEKEAGRGVCGMCDRPLLPEEASLSVELGPGRVLVSCSVCLPDVLKGLEEVAGPIPEDVRRKLLGGV